MNHKLQTGNKEVEKLYDDAFEANVNVIELRWSKNRENVARIMGFQVLRGKRLVDGQTTFNPDEKNRCWGYILDTPVNRKKLESSLAAGWYKIVDNKIHDEIVASATANGIQTTVNTKNTVQVKKDKERLMEEKMAQMQKESEELRKKLAKLELEAAPIAGAIGISVKDALGVKGK